MDAYHALAVSYDRLTNDVDYEATVSFYKEILKREGLNPRTAVDLACGTGSVALILARNGLEVTAVDMSEEMLAVGAQKAQEMENPPRFVCQSLQELRLPRGVDLAVCALDSLDYITDPADCAEAIRRIYKVLNPGGIFIFDVNTPEKLRAMDGQVFLDEDDDVYCIWRGEFDEESNICSYGMDLFQRDGNVWLRSFEEHREYAYSRAQLTGYLKAAGFTHIEVYADRLFEAPREGEQRIYLKARKGKLGAGSMNDKKIGESKLVYKYFQFLVNDHHMQFCTEELPDTEGIENPTYVYSFFNESGCFSLCEIAQRGEWDCYVARGFPVDIRERLDRCIDQREYLTGNVFLSHTFLNKTASYIVDQIKKTGKFWDIEI